MHNSLIFINQNWNNLKNYKYIIQTGLSKLTFEFVTTLKDISYYKIFI